MAPLEAMASGLPLVAPNRGGVLSYANQGNAWLADPTPDAFSAAIASAALPGTARQEKLQAALVTADSFRWENVTDSLLRLYRISRRRSRPSVGGTTAFFSTYASPPGGHFMRVVAGTAKKLLGAARAGISCQPSPGPVRFAVGG